MVSREGERIEDQWEMMEVEVGEGASCQEISMLCIISTLDSEHGDKLEQIFRTLTGSEGGNNGQESIPHFKFLPKRCKIKG